MKKYTNNFAKIILFSVIVAFPIGARSQGIPVYDNLGFINSLQQIANTIQQIKHQYDTLTNLQAQLKALTGERGMDSLLGDVNRDYLPQDWDQVDGMVSQMNGQYDGILRQIQQTTGKNAVLQPADIAKLPPDLQEIIQRMRNSIATESAMSKTAYRNASKNVNNIKLLISAIKTAQDPKAIADLSARVQAEQVMMQNDQIKLAQATQLHASEQRQIQQILIERAMRMSGDSRSVSTVQITLPGQ